MLKIVVFLNQKQLFSLSNNETDICENEDYTIKNKKIKCVIFVFRL